jgi:hypothetical protein
MTKNWAFYFAKIGGKGASVYGNLGLGAVAPKHDLPWLLKLSVRMKNPNADGMSNKEEADVLWKLEDAVVPALAQHSRAEFVGRITTDGHRDFYFYAPDNHGFEQAIGPAIAPFQYEYSIDSRRDAEWDFYFESINRTPWDWQVIRIRSVLSALMETGDDLSQPRGIYHWIYFKSADARARFAAAATAIGFQTREVYSENSKLRLPWGIQAHRVDSVNPGDIGPVCHQLFVLAMEQHGEYDGLETQAIKPGEQPTTGAPPKA